jgi:hypothetical protein
MKKWLEGEKMRSYTRWLFPPNESFALPGPYASPATEHINSFVA